MFRLRTLALSAAVLGLGAGAMPAVAAPAPTPLPPSLSGTVKGAFPKPGRGVATVRATNMATGAIADAAQADRRGGYVLDLPAGTYAVTTTVVDRRGTPSIQSIPLSLRPGQRRTKVGLVAKATKKPRKRKASRSASRLYVTENGSSVPGTTAFSIEPFTGGTGDWSYLGPGLTAMLQTDVQAGSGTCPTAQIANRRDRERILDELRLQKSKYFDPKTRVKRNFILGDITVTGTLATAAGGQSAAATVVFTDTRSGRVLDTVKANLTLQSFFDDAETLAKVVAERLCRRPASYDVALKIDGRLEAATHRATGQIDTNLIAIGSDGGERTMWVGNGRYTWANLVFTSNTICTYIDPVTSSGNWRATISVVDERTIKVDWEWAVDENAKLTSASAACPEAPPIPGQPGPSLIGVAPPSFTLPIGGGTGAISGGLGAPGGGFFQTGTLTVTPVWGQLAP